MQGSAMLARCVVVAVGGGTGLLLLSYMGPLQWPTVAAYTGLVTAACGLAGIVWPPRWVGVTRRIDAAFTALAGVVLLGVALALPVSTTHTSGTTRLDALMQAYDFYEDHEMRVHATPDRVMRAVHEITLEDIRTMQALGCIRNIATGHVEAGHPQLPSKPILELIAAGSIGFFPLDESDREYVFGMAGQPWNNVAHPERLTPDSFASWMAPGNVKIVANFRVEDNGGGWSRLTTTTRVQATDDAARRKMARYWRLIYPGSGLIRRSLLNAVRERAERS